METMEHLIANEAAIRGIASIVIFVVCAGLEVVLPKRPRLNSRVLRWTHNFLLVFLNSATMRIVFPLSTVAMANYIQENNLGLLNAVDLPMLVEVVIAVVLLDMAIYWQHRFFHTIPIFWLLHRMHHAETELDASSGARFHPFEIIVSMVVKFVVMVAVGVSPFAIIIFEIILNGTAVFNHSNLALPAGLDRFLRIFLVTPDMHRIHHSSDVRETNSNYGFNLPWWDYFFGSYVAEPKLGQKNMEIGLTEFREKKYLHISRLLSAPFWKS